MTVFAFRSREDLGLGLDLTDPRLFSLLIVLLFFIFFLDLLIDLLIVDLLSVKLTGVFEIEFFSDLLMSSLWSRSYRGGAVSMFRAWRCISMGWRWSVSFRVTSPLISSYLYPGLDSLVISILGICSCVLN